MKITFLPRAKNVYKKINVLPLIKPVYLEKADVTAFKKQFSSCIVLTRENKILLQQRGDNFVTFPGYLSSFGGRIEKDETPTQALIRELNEELGAVVNESDVVLLGAVTEKISDYQDLVYEYFWHDAHGTITGCYEGEARFFDDVESVLKYSEKIMDDVQWALKECQLRCF